MADLDYVWYACYGSNIYDKRFELYLKGGQLEGFTRMHIGSNDPTLPLESKFREYPYQLYFAHSSTSWQGRAVAFIEDHLFKTYFPFRLYKITKQQFIDVFAQENGLNPKLGVIDLNFEKLIQETRLNIGNEEDFTWYGRLMHIDTIDDIPVLTFSSKKILFDQPIQSPGVNYLAVIAKGLLQSGLYDKGYIVKKLGQTPGMAGLNLEKLWHQTFELVERLE